MIGIGTQDVKGSALGNGPDIGGENFGVALLEAFIALPRGFGDGAGQTHSFLPYLYRSVFPISVSYSSNFTSRLRTYQTAYPSTGQSAVSQKAVA